MQTNIHVQNGSCSHRLFQIVVEGKLLLPYDLTVIGRVICPECRQEVILGPHGKTSPEKMIDGEPDA